MERRRFVPRSESLEGRQLLSVAGATAPIAPEVQTLAPEPASAVEPTAYSAQMTSTPRVPTRVEPLSSTSPRAANEDPNTLALRSMRIDRLGALLQSVSRDRVVPPEILESLQDNLRAVEGRLNRVPSPGLRAFNLQLRSMLSRASVTTADVQALDRVFGAILERAGAPPEVVVSFQTDLLALAQVNIQQTDNPVPVVANDYATLLQTALGVGVEAPARPNARTPTGFAPGQIGGSPLFGR